MLRQHLKISFTLESFECKPFFHANGQRSRYFAILMEIWKIPVHDLFGTAALISSYVTEGHNPILLGTEILHTSDQLEKDSLLCNPARTMKYFLTNLFL